MFGSVTLIDLASFGADRLGWPGFAVEMPAVGLEGEPVLAFAGGIVGRGGAGGGVVVVACVAVVFVVLPRAQSMGASLPSSSGLLAGA